MKVLHYNKMADYLKPRLLPPVTPKLELRHTLTPPVADTIDDVISNSVVTQIRQLSNKVFKEIKRYVKAENISKPYTDMQILAYMQSMGYDALTRQDVAFARLELGIEPSSERQMQYSKK